jgi:D-alanine-D-alanine ligase
MTHHVAVLMGGWSAEREVSLVSGAAVSQSLTDSGNSVTSIDVQRDMGALMTRLYPRPDALFNALHGRFGEDGCVQGLMDILEIPYTHSGLLASALAMDKPMAKRLFAEVGIPVAEHKIVNREEALAGDVMAPPYVIKPLNEGSSVGVVIIRDAQDLDAITGDNWPYGTQVMIEKYIPGKELCVAVMGDRSLAVTEIETDHEFYDYDAKYVDGGSKHTIPARLDESVTKRILELAGLAHQTLGCRGVSRADFRLDGDTPYLLEINTQPGMTPTSLVPEQAAHVGITFNELVTWMVENAECDR